MYLGEACCYYFRLLDCLSDELHAIGSQQLPIPTPWLRCLWLL